MRILFLSLALFSGSVFGQSKVAIVKLLKGNVESMTIGKTVPLKADDWVENGAVIKTSEKSFVKLIFTDKSQMNIGPNSEMKIEKFSGKDSGVIDLVKGKIRSQVTKDYLQIDKNKSKMFIKTPNAVMGVRGTDFMIATNGKNTATVLFEGEIAFNKLNQRGSYTTDSLERIVDRGMRLFPGEFSVVDRERPQPTVPSLLNIQQREALEANDGSNSDRGPANTKEAPKHSVVPAGLDGKVVSNDSQFLKNEVNQISKDIEKVVPSSADPDGYVKGNLIKPANGSFVHIDSGTIIPPGPGSILDDNSNTYIPGQEMGKVAADGSYVPPENVEITGDGKVLVTVSDDLTGDKKVQQVQAPSPVQNGSLSLARMDDFLAENPSLVNTGTVVNNDILNTSFSPRGLQDLATTGTGSTSSTSSSGGITPNLPPEVRSGSGINIDIIK